MKRLPQVTLKNEYIPFKGGFDTETPQIVMKPGVVTRGQNYEQAVNGGYQTVKGYERFDGRTSPSDATYSVLAASSILATAVVGGTLTGATSHATGVIIAVTTTYIVITKTTGTFTAEDVTVSAAPAGHVTGYSSISDAKTNAQYIALAANVYRALIQVVPGSGAILGVWYYGGKTYAFRNNAAGTAAVMHVATSSGWAEVTLYKELSFTTGGAISGVIIPEGAVITGATSHATATVARVVTQSGSWAGGTAAGRLIVTGQTGTFQAENLTSGGVVAVATGNSAQISFAVPGGRFNFVNENFGGGVTTERMYGCDGKNRGFEFDGTVLVPIVTGMTVDTPELVCAHKWHLFFSFFGSVQHSAPGEPYNWTVISGAAEIGISSAITGFISMPGSQTSAALAIFAKNEVAVLYGTGSSNWNMATFKKEIGAYPYSVKLFGNVLFLDDRGITNMVASQVYGNFETAVVSQNIHSWLSGKGSIVKESCIVRDKNQYRIFFSDKSALYLTLDNGKVQGIMPIVLDHTVDCMCSIENASGFESIFFGSTDGYVYEMEKGTSFDGENIECFIDIAYSHFKSPNISKRYRKLTLEISGDGYAEMYANYAMDYASTLTAQPTEVLQTIGLSSLYWDSGAYWDSGLYWDGSAILPLPIQITGSGFNFAVRLRSEGDHFKQMKISGAQVLYSSSRIIR